MPNDITERDMERAFAEHGRRLGGRGAEAHDPATRACRTGWCCTNGTHALVELKAPESAPAPAAARVLAARGQGHPVTVVDSRPARSCSGRATAGGWEGGGERWSLRQRRGDDRRELQPVPPVPEHEKRLTVTSTAHGTASCYSAGCRCALCKAARSDYRRSLYERRRAGAPMKAVLHPTRRRRPAGWERPEAALLLDMGLGKTLIALTALVDLATVGEDVWPALVIAPLMTARHVWPAEVAKWDHTRHLQADLVLGSASEREAALRRPAEIYVVNRENVQWLTDRYGPRWPFRTVVVDELWSRSHRRSAGRPCGECVR
ncbi:MAG: SNF2-related protein [Gordonibacter pamelaeae]